MLCCAGPSLIQLFATPWTVACQTPWSMEFSRQEYWSRLPFPSADITMIPEQIDRITLKLVTNVFILGICISLGFPCGSAGKESTCNVGDLGLIPGLGRSPREGKGYPLQYSCQEISMDWLYSPYGVAKSQTWLSNFHCHFLNFKLC